MPKSKELAGDLSATSTAFSPRNGVPTYCAVAAKPRQEYVIVSPTDTCLSPHFRPPQGVIIDENSFLVFPTLLHALAAVILLRYTNIRPDNQALVEAGVTKLTDVCLGSSRAFNVVANATRGGADVNAEQWEASVRIEIAYLVFSRMSEPDFKKRLLLTGGKPIRYTSSDTVLGWGTSEEASGRNLYGEALTAASEQIISKRPRGVPGGPARQSF
jgi:hypothetical protein